MNRFPFLIVLVLFLIASSVRAYDLNQVRIEKLDNGLTVMILEDHTQPLVSTQMLYKAGGRNECTGATGLAHFLEHMAFRATKTFPNTDVVSRIYAEGGEWHGYTWLDQTTYFETVPAEDFDLVLQIQADRMANTLIRAEEVEAERGAVLTELYGYQNDPASTLADAVAATAFQQHPYRYNVIGWPSDVERITHQDLVNFYKRFYNPSNAILAISGDISSASAILKVKNYFGSIPGVAADSLPRTVEPLQAGERRLVLTGPGQLNYFNLSYKAPAASNADFPAFLLLQGILGGTSGVNFRQDTYQIVRPKSRLAGIGSRTSTYFIPTANPYLFSITGKIPIDGDTKAIEDQIEKQISAVRDSGVTPEELNAALKSLNRDLIFDIETTEDAAHQMAYWEGIGAFEVLRKLSSLLAGVKAEDVQRVARKYLQQHQRTVGWYLSSSSRLPISDRRGAGGFYKTTGSQSAKIEPPKSQTLKNGISLIVQKVQRTPTVYLSAIIPTNTIDPDADHAKNSPVWGTTTVGIKLLSQEVESGIHDFAEMIKKGFPVSTQDPAEMDDPEARLNLAMQDIIGLQRKRGKHTPLIIVAVGDLDSESAFRKLSTAFDGFEEPSRSPAQKIALKMREQVIRIPGKAQSQIGYIVPAPAPDSQEAYTWRILRYIMAHDYEGRLGKEMIGRLGLIYYVGSGFNSDRDNGWVYFTMGVNPDKLPVVRQKFQEIMRGLVSEPPTSEEVAEAKNHLIGRRETAYQSNEEIAGFLAGELIEQGTLLRPEEFEKRINAVSLEDVRSVVSNFLSGATIIVDTSN